MSGVHRAISQIVQTVPVSEVRSSMSPILSDEKKVSSAFESESDASLKSGDDVNRSSVKKLKPVKAKVTVVDGDQMFVC